MEHKLADAGYEALAFAVIERAVLDCYDARFYLDTLDERYIRVDPNGKETREEKLERITIKLEGTIKDVELFLKGPMFELYSQERLDGGKALNSMRETYKREIYPAMYEKFLDDEYRAAIRRSKKYFKKILEEHSCS